MRLFVAVDVDAAARAALAAQQQQLRTIATGSLRWVRPEHLHITLVFLGEVPDDRATGVIEAYAQPAPVAAFDLAFRGIGVFPPRGAPRALWIGVAVGEGELAHLQQVMTDRASRLGIALEARAFSPHLTIARWKDSRPSDRQRVTSLAASTGSARDADIARVRVARATLYRSQLSSAGPTYTALAHVTLAASR